MELGNGRQKDTSCVARVDRPALLPLPSGERDPADPGALQGMCSCKRGAGAGGCAANELGDVWGRERSTAVAVRSAHMLGIRARALRIAWLEVMRLKYSANFGRVKLNLYQE